MSGLKRRATLAFWAVAGITLTGCGAAPQPAPSANGPSEQNGAGTKAPGGDMERSQAYVTCTATLTALENDYQWFDDGDAGHDDGVAPLASFVLQAPQAHADRAMSILFKYSWEGGTLSPSDADIGRQYAFEVPGDFLTGESNTIDNASVRRLRKVEE